MLWSLVLPFRICTRQACYRLHISIAHPVHRFPGCSTESRSAYIYLLHFHLFTNYTNKFKQHKNLNLPNAF